MSELLVARVIVDTPLPHLDRLFDYAIPEALAPDARPGVRVRIRFAGRLKDGWITEIVQSSQHEGRLASIEKIISSESVLTTQIYQLARAVADRWSGTVSDVLRSAIPPRQAKVEAEPLQPTRTLELLTPHEQIWTHYGGVPQGRAVVSVAPHHDALELAAHAMLASRSAIVVVPDARDLARFLHFLKDHIDPEHIVVLTADLGPAKRYRQWLKVRRGQVHHVVGTRAATFAPIDDVERLIIVHDGDDSHVEPHAPYWHAREVLALRSHLHGSDLLIIDHARTAEAQLLVKTGWATSIEAPRELVRSMAAQVNASGDEALLERDSAALSARMPSIALQAIREGLKQGAVLVWNPRGGYVPRLSCQECRTTLACPDCTGGLALRQASGVPVCTRCGRLCGDVRCPSCASSRYRAVGVGASRTAEEIGRAFANVAVKVSSRDHMITEVDSEPQIVICTPGSEPWTSQGFSAAVLLDAHVALSRPDLRAEEETLRRWMEVASRVRPDGRVVVVAPPSLACVQALIRWDPIGHADLVLAERESMRMVPAAKTVELSGPLEAVQAFIDEVELARHAKVLGPVSTSAQQVRTYISVPRAEGASLVGKIKAVMAARSAKKAPLVTVRVDPSVIG